MPENRITRLHDSASASVVPAFCGGRLRLIALIEQAAVIDRVLRYLGLPTTIPAPSPPRAVGLPDDAADWGNDMPPSDSCS